MKRRITIVCLLLMSSSAVFAGKIEKAFAALEIYNYFEAKRLFEKAENKLPVASCYGLSIIYQRTDNPFSNIDSAYNKILKSLDNYSALKPKLREKYLIFGLDSVAIVEQRNKISDILFKSAIEKNSVASYETFAKKHPWSIWNATAIYRRDSLAFESAILTGKAHGFADFLQQYPNSSFSTEAKSSFDRLLYVENTVTDNFVDYLSFLEKYPESPYRPDAEDKIYEISTRLGTRESYEHFIKDFPDNRNVQNAWKKLFNTSLQEEYSLSSLREFKEKFPDYPFTDELEDQLELVEIVLFPVMKERRWGFISADKRYQVDMAYQDVESFAEGLAAVKLNDKYGYIDKLGEMVVQPSFDDALEFNEGHAIVEIEGLWGMINRGGEYTIDPIYEDLGELKNGLSYFQEGDFYGYFDEKGVKRISAKYTDAYDFEGDKAIVAVNDEYGLIDPFGTVFIQMKYEDLNTYTDDLYKAKLRSNWGLIDEAGDTVVPFLYDYIGKMNDDRAIVERGGEFNYISPKGNLMLKNWVPTYSEFRQLATFRNGYAKIRFKDAYNLVDTSGKKLYPRDQADLGQFGNLIAVKKGRHWGYLTKTGSTSIPNTFTMANSFEGDYAVAGSEPLWGIINEKGKYVIEPYFEQLSFLNDSIILAKSRGNYGLLDIKGDTLLNFSFVSIEPKSDEIVEVQQKASLFYYHLGTQEFLRKED